jgi:hypothetical protein
MGLNDIAMRPSYRLLGIIQEYAQDAIAQQICADAYNELQRRMLGAQRERGVTKIMAGMLYDGLAYGNWPWVSFNVDDLLAGRAKK